MSAPIKVLTRHIDHSGSAVVVTRQAKGSPVEVAV